VRVNADHLKKKKKKYFTCLQGALRDAKLIEGENVKELQLVFLVVEDTER